MSDRPENNPYTFNEFLQWRNGLDYYRDDPFIRKTIRRFAGDEWESIDAEARRLSPVVSFRWREMAESAALPEKRPWMAHYDGHHNRIDRIVRPREAEIMEREIFSEKLFSSGTSPMTKLMKMYLIYQNGEACIACPLTCTEGMVAILERFADTPETKRILEHCREGIDGDFAIGAQYLSEIQGGSEVPANVLEAVREGETWRLYGTKFFCSAVHADYAIITARPAGSEKIALFVMPSWMPGKKEKRNGYTIDRIKWKLGTSELPTAEITLDGAVAYQVGPLDRGVANVVGIVLTYSRLTVGLSSAAIMTRAAREAKGYADFREAFGVKIGRFPLVAGQLERVDHCARRTTAGAFRLYREFLDMGGELRGGLESDESAGMRARRFNLRELIMLQKIASATDCTDTVRAAMSVFGGHGVIEDFSSLPRLYRDAAVNELWEGPRNVLLTQIHRDCRRASAWRNPPAFVADILEGADRSLIRELGGEMDELVAHPDLMGEDDRTREVCMQWDDFCHRLYHAYQDLALAEVEGL